jgi:uncharacterized protein
MMGLIFFIGLMLLMALAAKNVQATFQRYSQVPVRSRMTGAQAARYILDQNGLQNVRVERVQGSLTDHYDPRDKTLRLSEPVHDAISLSAVGVAAHEAGHAIQDKTGYFALQLRQSFYPLASVGSNLGWILIFVGAIMASTMGQMGILIALAGLVLYGCAVLFTVITLPVEFDASKRAMVCLSQYNIVNSEEYTNTKKVLNAAALTYVAAALAAVLTLLYYAWIIFGNRD